MANEQTAMEYYFFGVEEETIEKANSRSKEETKGDYWGNVLDLLIFLHERQTLYKDLSDPQKDWLDKIQGQLT